MNSGKPIKTLADYLVIALSPALIILLVHSLCFFLVDIFYHGTAGGVRWVLFWFVLAAVLIARIGIEQGTGHAMVYGLALAGATWCYLAIVQGSIVFGAVLLAIVWFTAHKLTLNCTLIDDDIDASGQGLLQPVRRLPQLFQKLKKLNLKTAVLIPALHTPPPAASTKKAPAPGIWLIYYSLAALPIFGLGQTLLPAGDLEARHRGLVYLFLYLASALGLLMTTSFLGLRRYLRQRYLDMPGYIAFGWVQFGVIAAGVVLCLSLFLPRPGAGEAWGTLRYKVDTQLRRASEYAARFNPHGTGSGRAGNQSSANGQQENSSAQTDQKSDLNPDKTPGGGAQGDKPSGGPQKTDGTTGQAGGEKPGQPSTDLAPAARSIYSWLKFLFLVVVLIVFAWVIYRYRVMILMALQSAWAALRNFIATLFGYLKPAAQILPPGVKPVPVASFKSFTNPFLTGSDQLWPPEKLITYSYCALQSRVLDPLAEPGSPQTPREFCRQLSLEMPDLATELEQLALLYGHVAYGASLPASYNPEHLRSLWSKLPPLGRRLKAPSNQDQVVDNH